MRVGTAVGITTVIIIAEGAITWFAAKAWLAIRPDRTGRGPCDSGSSDPRSGSTHGCFSFR
jgi:hypothetical protein